MKEYSTPPDKDPKLWEIARKRASFKTNLFSYIVINIFFWLLWYSKVIDMITRDGHGLCG